MKRWVWVVILVLSALAVAGCSSRQGGSGDAAAEAEGDAPPVVVKANKDVVIAEGVVEPGRSSRLSFKIPGEVVDVLVVNGERVQTGMPLLRLDTRELSLALRSAEQDVLAQQAVLEQLRNGASAKVIARADKGTADQIAQAEVALDAKLLQLERARAENPSIGVAAAQARVKQIEYSLAKARVEDPGPSVTSAEVALERARIALSDTQDEYNKAIDRPWEDQGIRDAWSKRLEQAQLDYKAAQAQLDHALSGQRAHQVGLNILAAQIEEAKTQLDQALIAQKTYALTLGTLATEVRAAGLNLAALQTTDNPYRDEASDEEIAQAAAMVEKTQIAVERLRVQLEDAEIAAPYDGAVVDVQVEVGDQVQPGQIAVVIATPDEREVRTTDLTELEVGGVSVGQPVKITVDAFPGQEFAGTVHEIALEGKDYRGDVVYEVTIALDDPERAGHLRWGMTAMVEIETSQ
ncbi:MAG: HlyD family efflux transporter periplasmic adaptor subunit [Chloroflexi bacterium]|nr:HlyD family efflux transporter periplasmic adaptor subunit [Chloroflexota bacterium]MBL7201130.1 HlyD family efflux transporter periplasmic adaptor subunit [Anaerolineae bacterium]